jgi:UDP-N-acetylmuramyl pentapeptide phosphotransferase/UDP-N-acetylglucosamine-1-phosphate transferase
MPRIIFIATKNRLLDTPDNERKVHKKIITNLGGIGIYISFLVVSLFSSITLMNFTLYGNISFFHKWNYIIISTLTLFITGVKDDLAGLSPSKKIFAQAVAAFIVVYFADIRLNSFHGIFGIHELPYFISVLFSVTGIIFVTNAFNLIDGIDGLAGTIASVILAILSLLFFANRNYNEAILSITLLGASMGFLFYNLSPARIFMGDTGSLIIGFLIATLCIIFINDIHTENRIFVYLTGSGGATLLTLALLIIPIFDTFRVFTIRILKGGSPFHADRNHLHHKLLDANFSHHQIVLTFSIVFLVLLAITYSLHFISTAIACIALFSSITVILIGFSIFLKPTKKD